MKISVCIPMYNEIGVICANALKLSEYLRTHFEDYELIFCSDGSTDGCAEAVRALSLPNTQVVEYFPNRGKGFAVRTAMLKSTGDIRVFTDADLAYGLEVIESIYIFSLEHPEAAVIIGSRSHSGGFGEYTALRTLASRIYTLSLKILCGKGMHFSDSQCGLKAYTGKAAEDIFPRCGTDNFAFDIETLMFADALGYSVLEMPVEIKTHGSSKVHLVKDAVTMLLEIPKIRRRTKNT